MKAATFVSHVLPPYGSTERPLVVTVVAPNIGRARECVRVYLTEQYGAAGGNWKFQIAETDALVIDSGVDAGELSATS